VAVDLSTSGLGPGTAQGITPGLGPEFHRRRPWIWNRLRDYSRTGPHNEDGIGPGHRSQRDGSVHELLISTTLEGQVVKVVIEPATVAA